MKHTTPGSLVKRYHCRRNRLIVSKLPGTPLPMHARTQQNSCVSTRLQEWAVSSRTTWDLRPTARLLAVISLFCLANRCSRSKMTERWMYSVRQIETLWLAKHASCCRTSAVAPSSRLCKVETKVLMRSQIRFEVYVRESSASPSIAMAYSR